MTSVELALNRRKDVLPRMDPIESLLDRDWSLVWHLSPSSAVAGPRSYPGLASSVAGDTYLCFRLLAGWSPTKSTPDPHYSTSQPHGKMNPTVQINP